MRSFVPVALLVVGSLAVLAAEHDAAQEEVAQWQGTWRAVSMLHDGEEAPAEKLKPIKLTVEGNRYHFQNGDFQERGTYRFDPSQKPKALDIVVDADALGADSDDAESEGKTYLVIYQVEGDELTICLRGDNAERPTEFTGAKGSGCVLEVWHRETPAAE